ncbi:phage protein NinX family protein, partial [Xenorhabdus anantnagensis]
MKIKTSELTGRALDWAVCLALGARISDGRFLELPSGYFVDKNSRYYSFKPSTDWAQCGQLIETHHVELNFNSVSKEWAAYIFNFEELESVIEDGESPTIAICRAVVAAQLG